MQTDWETDVSNLITLMCGEKSHPIAGILLSMILSATPAGD